MSFQSVTTVGETPANTKKIVAPSAEDRGTDLPKLLTIGEAAALLAMGYSTVRRLINQGVIPAVRIESLTRIEAAELHRFVESHRTEGDR
jgi:excisionase family DNA binding protein